MMNTLDANETAKAVADLLRVRMQWQRVDISAEDIDRTVNFTLDLLSNYIDDKNILNKQYNPATNRTEEVEISNDVTIDESN